MAITINGRPLIIAPAPEKKAAEKKKSTHTQPKKPPISLDEPGRLRNAHIQYLLGGLSQSALRDRITYKNFPRPDGRDPRPFWATETVRQFLQKK